MSELLEVRGLHKSYRSGGDWLHILVDLDLEVTEGEMLAVTGASGSGKSTFLHLVGGMDRPERGEILFEGRDVAGLEPRELARFRNQRIGFVFQFHHLLPEFSALENVMFPLLLRRVPFDRAAEQARAYIGEVGLADRASHRPGELSGGEQQRVALARALAGEPKLLLADEPTGNLDHDTAGRVMDLLERLHRAHGLTSVLATHNLDLAQRANRTLRLADGKLTETVVPEVH